MMYDSVFAPCSNCGELIEFQSKAGECKLRRYKHTSVPAEIAADLISNDEDGKPYYRGSCCNRVVRLKGEIPRVHLNIEEWRDEDEKEWD